MITPSLIYIAVTIILAMVDAIRIRKAKGVVENINHKMSVNLAIYWGAFSLTLWTVLTYKAGDWHWNYIPKVIILIVAFVAIRFIFFDPLLNIFRRMKIDYESPTTSSYIDQHTNKLRFWEKRAIGVAGWGICAYVYFLIFKK